MLAPVLGDVIDESVVTTQKRQEGIFNGFLQFFGRLAILVQAIVFATVQTFTGFKEGEPLSAQPASAIWGVHIHTALIPAIFMLLATIVFWRYYDLTPDKVTFHQDKIDVMEETIQIKFVPKPEDLDFKEIIDKLVEKMGVT
jgi:Na+/melibiose symporter-like transporter